MPSSQRIPQQQQPRKITDAYKIFVLDNQSRRFTKATITTYRDRLEPFINWCPTQNAESLDEVTPSLIRLYLVALQERQLSDYTINGVARCIKTFFNFCVREGLLAESPMKKVAMPKIDKRILPALSVEDAQKLLKVCEGERDAAIVLFMLDTGVRATELINLNGGDIDQQTGTVAVRQGKGRKDRVVYVGAKARKQLLRYYMRRGEPKANEAVWLSEKSNERLTTSGLRQLLERLSEASGIKKCSPHTLRRTFALWSLRNGMSIYHLQRLMGHADITVLRIYLDLAQGDLQQAHNDFGAVDNLL
ncbi:MAG: tyrosine-type recombinase/integrase [Caldilineaceae bacterium]